MTSHRLVFSLAALLLSAVGAGAHDEDLRSGRLRPTVGQISDEVAVQRLRASGVDDPRVLSRQDGTVMLEGTIDGRATRLKMDSLRGRTVEEATPSRVIVAPGMPVERPLVSGPQLRTETRMLSDPSLMRDAVRQQP